MMETRALICALSLTFFGPLLAGCSEAPKFSRGEVRALEGLLLQEALNKIPLGVASSHIDMADLLNSHVQENAQSQKGALGTRKRVVVACIGSPDMKPPYTVLIGTAPVLKDDISNETRKLMKRKLSTCVDGVDIS